MSPILELLEDLLPAGSLTDSTLFTKTPSDHVTVAGCHLMNPDQSRKNDLRKKEYLRQLFAVPEPNQVLVGGALHLLTAEDIQLLKDETLKKYERQLRRKMFSEKAAVKEMLSSDSRREKRREKTRVSHQDKSVADLRNRLGETRKENRILRKKLETERQRTSVLRREKAGDETKLGKLSSMVQRMKVTLLEMESLNESLQADMDQTKSHLDQTKADMDLLNSHNGNLLLELDQTIARLDQTEAERDHLKTDIDSYKTELDDRDADYTSLQRTLTEATELMTKLELEFNRVLKETADDDYKCLRGSQLALLRKTTPCMEIDIAAKYEPVVDDQGFTVTLGSGNFGTVMAFREKHVPFGVKNVAVKVLNDDDDEDEDGEDNVQVRRQEVLLEARLLKLFAGSGAFPRVLGVGTIPLNRTAIVMEFLGDDGSYQVTTLTKWTSSMNSSAITVQQAASVLHDALNGLKAMHAMDILHNDVKGDNIIVKKNDVGDYSGYLIDLGGATTTFLPGFYDFNESQRETYRQDPLAIHYAPELVFDDGLTSTASDVYQIGRAMYMTGQDLTADALMNISERCICRNPEDRPKLEEVIELVANIFKPD